LAESKYEPRPQLNDWNASIVEEFRANGGVVGGRYKGLPVLLITHTGRKTGALRTNPVAYLADGGRYIIFASKRGAPTNPAWYWNIRANPEVTVEVGRDKFEATAEEITGAERDSLFEANAELHPQFAGYQRSTSRKIPVIALTPRVPNG
jgi:deazaflavin-dependent oxidoreductase (nitroreductase family)